MKKIFFPLIVVCLLFTASTATAISISFNPVDQEVAVGGSVDVDLVISELGDYSPDSLSVFDLDVSFDDSILAFNSLTFGDQLDLGWGSWSGFDDSVAGVVNLFESSNEFPWDLDFLQAGSFTLATLTFDALAFGTSSLDLSVNVLGDAWGDSFNDDIAIADSSITATSPVPEPGTFILLIVGLAGLGFWKRKKDVCG